MLLTSSNPLYVAWLPLERGCWGRAPAALAVLEQVVLTPVPSKGVPNLVEKRSVPWGGPRLPAQVALSTARRMVDFWQLSLVGAEASGIGCRGRKQARRDGQRQTQRRGEEAKERKRRTKSELGDWRSSKPCVQISLYLI